MADAPLLAGDQGEMGRRGLRRRAFAAVIVLTAVNAEMQAAAQAPRDAPRVLTPVESNVGVARVQVRGYLLAFRDGVTVYVLDPEDEKSKGTAEGKRLQQILSRGRDFQQAQAGPTWRQFSGAGGMPGLLGAPGKEAKLKAVPLKRLAEEAEAKPAEQVVPLRAALVAASFPFKAQVEEFRAKLRRPNAEAVLSEQGPDGAPTFRFLGVRVQRRTLDAAGKALTPYADLDLAAAYTPYLLLSGKRFEPEKPPALQQVIVRGLVMPKLLAFQPDQYPHLESGLKTLRKTLEQVSKPTAPPAPGRPSDVNKAEGDAPPGTAKPRPDPFAPGTDKPRKAPPANPTRAKAAPDPLGLPEYCLLRIVDPTIQPGRVYQYRLQVRMANPNYGRKDVAAPDLARAKEIESDWYEVPQKVVVSPELVYYAVDQQELDGDKNYRGIHRGVYPNKHRTVLQIHRWLEAFTTPADPRNPLPVGEWVIAERVLAHRGEYIGFDQRIEFPYWRTTQERFVVATEPKATRRAPGVPVSFRPDRPDGRDTLLVDFEGGRQDYQRRLGPGLTREVRDSHATEVLLMTPDGKLLALEGARDAADKERRERLHQVREWIREVKGAREGRGRNEGTNPFGRE
jgi:hypothetical protein